MIPAISPICKTLKWISFLYPLHQSRRESRLRAIWARSSAAWLPENCSDILSLTLSYCTAKLPLANHSCVIRWSQIVHDLGIIVIFPVPHQGFATLMSWFHLMFDSTGVDNPPIFEIVSFPADILCSVRTTVWLMT